MSDLRFECPACKTSYSAERCGIQPLRPEESGIVTIKCMVCGVEFNVEVLPRLVTSAPGWWARTVLRRQPTTTQDGHTTESTLR